MVRNIGSLILIATIILGLSACFKSNGNEQPADNKIVKDSFLANIKTTKAVLGEEESQLSLSGKVEYDPDRIINYVPLVGGIVERTYFSLGDKVRKGEALLELRSTELSLLQADLTSLESEVKIAERELKSVRAMYNDNMSSEKELLEAEAKLQQVRATLTRVQTDMSFFGYNKESGTFSIKAPVTGYIVNKNISSGSTIAGGGDPLFTIADLSNVWIMANVYASNLMFVKEGMDVRITTLSYPGEVFSGKINTLSQVFDPEEKVLKARIVMPNGEMKFKPEMSVVVILQDQTGHQFVSVPSEVLIFDDNRYFVVVREADGQFRIREVLLQGHNAGVTYIAAGVSAGEDIVVKNQLLVYAGLKDTF